MPEIPKNHDEASDGGLRTTALFAVGDRVRYVTSEGIVTRIVHGNRYRVRWDTGTYAGKERYHEESEIHSANV